MWVVRVTLTKFSINFISPLIQNSILAILRVSGETVIESRTAREMFEGRLVNLVVAVDFIASPLRSLGIPIPDYGIGDYKMYKNSFGVITALTGTEFGPYEHFLRTEDGHIANEVFKIYGKR